MEYKAVLGMLAPIIGFIGYVPYFRDIFRGTTKPHMFSWFVWVLLLGTAFFAQIAEGAGAWVTGFTAIVCLFIAVLAFSRGEKNITRLDWVCFVGALLGILLWKATSDPLSAIIIIIIVDIFAFAPTFRKAYGKPYEETALTYAASSVKFTIALFALEAYTLATVLYPAYLVCINAVFVGMVLSRRSQK